ncbi:MAG: biotin/lipoyl-binding protein [Nitrospira sp.]|nr:biotin/lipoyl-binding protein [Nitrospira sp.]
MDGYGMKVELPFLAEGIDGGDVVQLLVHEGDRVTEGQSLLELETEKPRCRFHRRVLGSSCVYWFNRAIM